ncbi:hypothetical protein GCM10027589_12980 [Actinocorallia lasiicapitis]
MNDMPDQQFFDNRGYVKNSPGDSFVIILNSLLRDAKGRTPREQATDELRSLYRRFVHPPGFDQAQRVLESHRTVFLDAPHGSGGRAAARMLLWPLASAGAGLHELVLQDPAEGALINLTHVGDEDLIWLDLSLAEPSTWNAVRPELSQLRETVQQRSAHLVVLLPYSSQELGFELGEYRARIKPPALDEVFKRCLRLKGFLPDEVPAGTGLPENARSLEKVAEFVDLVAEARDGAAGQGSFSAWYAEASKALSGRVEDVAALVKELKQGTQRAFLLAAAMLEGVHADTVQAAAVALQRMAEHPDDTVPILERATLDVRLAEVKAELDAGGRIRFQRLNYAAAVRAYAWTHMPGLRTALVSWMKDLAGWPALEDEERTELIRRFTRQCLNDRYRSTLTDLIGHWTAGQASAPQVKAAAMVLLHGLQDADQGRFFRGQIYDWSRKRDLSRPLVEVIIAVSRDEIAVSHPDQAVVRLHRLVRNGHDLARETLLELVTGNRALRRQLLQRLTDRRFGAGAVADLGLFLDIADPVALTALGPSGRSLIDLNTVHGQLIVGWELVFSAGPPESWVPLAERWLELAASDRSHIDDLLNAMVTGGARHTDALSRLYRMAQRPDLRPLLGDPLFAKINEAQGLLVADV